jgi:hypothetical protein
MDGDGWRQTCGSKRASDSFGLMIDLIACTFGKQHTPYFEDFMFVNAVVHLLFLFPSHSEVSKTS